MRKWSTRIDSGLMVFLMLLAAGCRQGLQYSPEDEARYVKPIVVVQPFQVKSPVEVPWNIGQSLAESLSQRLVITRRYEVRGNVAAPASANAETTPISQGQGGRWMYAIRGEITDFGAVSGRSGLAGAFSADKYWVVRAVINIVDLETGQVVNSQPVEARVAKKEADDAVDYSQMAFGGYAFSRTSLGRATGSFLDDAVALVAASITEREWQPKVASVLDNHIVINGGANRQIQRGTVYVVRQVPQEVRDPDRQHSLGYVAGRVVGRIRVVQVTERFSLAEVVSGSGFAPGQPLFISAYNTAREPVRSSSY